MKMDEILFTIKRLSRLCGFYGRLYKKLVELEMKGPPGAYAQVCAELEGQNFRDPVDMVLYFET